ncbi:MAG: hypothetical protein GY778_28775 [bacterium]|nr:hypothetical protein [bacterium]
MPLQTMPLAERIARAAILAVAEEIPINRPDLIRQAVTDAVAAELHDVVEVPVPGQRFWSCKMGPAPRPCGDAPLREAAEIAFHRMFGCWPDVTFSGWGAALTRTEREIASQPRKVMRPGLPDDSAEESGSGI